MGPNGQDRGRNRSLAIIAWLTPTKLNSPPMRRPEIEAAQTSAKAKGLAGQRIGLNCESVAGRSYSICLLPAVGKAAACDLPWLRSGRWFFGIRVSQERGRADHLEWEWNVFSLQLSP